MAQAEQPEQPPEPRPAADAAEKAQFIRLARSADDKPVALQTAIVRYAPGIAAKTGPTVDLVGAVHVADRAYYKELNRLLADYDAVLYELVAPEGATVPKEGTRATDNPLSFLHHSVASLLELQFQLDGIDYTPQNFVHADLSREEFAESMRKRGEGVFEMFLRMLGHAMAQQKPATSGQADLRLLLALFDKNRALIWKRALAEQFEDLGGSLAALEGPKGSTLISERNKRAIEVLQKQIEAGKKKLAIFYGAGHMPDFDRRLRDQFGLTPLGTRWLVAWDLRDSKQRAAEARIPPAADSVQQAPEP